MDQRYVIDGDSLLFRAALTILALEARGSS